MFVCALFQHISEWLHFQCMTSSGVSSVLQLYLKIIEQFTFSCICCLESLWNIDRILLSFLLMTLQQEYEVSIKHCKALKRWWGGNANVLVNVDTNPKLQTQQDKGLNLIEICLVGKPYIHVFCWTTINEPYGVTGFILLIKIPWAIYLVFCCCFSISKPVDFLVAILWCLPFQANNVYWNR